MMTEKEIEAMEDKIHAMSIAELRAMAENARICHDYWRCW